MVNDNARGRSTTSLARRVAAGVVGIVAGALGLAALLAWLLARHGLYQECDRDLQRLVGHLARAPGHAYMRGPPELRGGAAVARIGDATQVHWQSADWPAGLPQMPSTDLGLDQPPVTLSAADGSRWRVCLRPHRGPPRARPGGRFRPPPPGSVVAVAMPLAGLEADLRRLAGLLVLVAVGVSVLAALLAGWLQRSLLRPLAGLGRAIEGLPTDDLGARLPAAERPVELAAIAERLDGLLERLDQARQRERRTVADIAHELRTPLADLRSRIGFGVEAGGLAAAELRQLDRPVAGLAAQIDQLLLLSRLEAGNQVIARQPVEWTELVADAWRAVRAPGYELAVAGDAAGRLLGDPALLQMALRNLMANAVAHGRPGTITVAYRAQDAGATLAVSNPSDAAPGDWTDALRPYWRASADRQDSQRHSGLGLAVVQRIVAGHGGEVRVWVDAGGMFTVELFLPSE